MEHWECRKKLVMRLRQFSMLSSRFLVIVVVVALFVWYTVLPAVPAQTYAFSAYYTSARLTLKGQAGPRFCDQWFFEQERALGFGKAADRFCPNLPTTALLMAPVAWLPPAWARLAWIVCDLAMLAAICVLGWRV